MAGKLRLLAFLWLVIACYDVATTTALEETTVDPAATTVDPAATTADPAATTVDPAATTKDPEATTKDPAATTVDPAATTKDPEATTKDPAATTKDPEATTKDPAATTKDPEATTKDPEATTKDPAATTTKDPAATTKDPAATTKDPAATTKDPEATTKDPAATTKDPEATTKDPEATTKDPPATTVDPGPCVDKPCKDGSTCENQADKTYVCLCPTGTNYNYTNEICEKSKVFPGQLTVESIPFVDALKVTTSPQFKEAAKTITDKLDEVYKKEPANGYTNSIVLKFQQSPTESKLWTRSGAAIASVEIIFNVDSPITTEKFTETMKGEVTCKDCPLTGTFVEEKVCNCDETSTTCDSKDGRFTCKCNENYIETKFSNQICIACPSGQQAKNGTCVDCSFGRSGFNCTEDWKLTLVIVGSVLGALLLMMIIVVIVVALKPSKKKSKKSKNADSGEYAGPAPIKAPLVSNAQAPAVAGSAFGNAGVPRIPRATPNGGWESRTNLEMTQSNTRQTPTPVGRNQGYEDQGNMNPYAQSRQSSLYGQGRPQGNPYAQNRAQANNPYAQNQGQTNPYYVHDDGRRY